MAVDAGAVVVEDLVVVVTELDGVTGVGRNPELTPGLADAPVWELLK